MPTIRRLLLGLLVSCVLSAASPARAQDLSGTYVAEDAEGRATLTLRVDAQGRLSGALSGPGYTLEVAGAARGAAFEGRASLAGQPEASLGLRGRLAGSALTVETLDPEDGGVMDRLVFTRQGAPASTPTPPAPPPANPLGAPPAGSGNPLAAPPPAPFAGRFFGDGVVLELAAQGPAYAGTLTFQGQRMPCRAAPQGSGLAGTFTAGGQEFELAATPTPQGGLALSSGGNTYTLAREGPPANPLAGAGAGAAAPAPTAQDLPVEVRHPLGLSVRVPAGWTTQELERGLRLVPPGQDPTDPNADELHFFIGEPLADEVRSPGDPQVAQYFDQLIAASFPNLRRTAPPEVQQTPAGPTAVLTWTGSAPSGQPVKGRAYVAFVQRNGGALVSIGLTAKVDARDATLRAVSGSLRPCASPANPGLVGRWVQNGGWSSADNRTYSSSQTSLTLAGDGAFVEASLGYVTTPAGVVESNERKAGRWQASGAVLTLRYEDGGVVTYRYAVAGGQLTLTRGDGASSRWGRGV